VGIREKLNENPAITTGATLVIVLIAVIFIVWQLIPHNPPIATKDFYTDDDGATYFTDDIKLVPPFDHNGKEAVRARVFQCPGSGKFVGYMEKYSPNAKKQLDAAMSKPATQGPPAFDPMLEANLINGRLIKKPGEGKWVNQQDPTFQKIVDVHCPDGGTQIELVTP
jgi:hypothetical protein